MAPDLAAAPHYVRIVADECRKVVLAVLKRATTPLPPADNPIVLSVVRDERPHLPDFLDHYRGLGVARFAFVDNGSTDGTAEVLAAQPDVDLYQVLAPFSWPVKQGWISRLVRHYGQDRWYVYADADEHLVYDGCDDRPLQDLVAVAAARKIERVRGFLLDMYRDGPLIGAADGQDAPLRAAFPYFDGDGYREEATPELLSRKGGPRYRRFAAIDPAFDPELTKYPLFRLGPDGLMANPHHIWPYDGNFGTPCLLAMLHYKFLPHMLGKIDAAIDRGSYWQNSLEYRIYLEAMARDPATSFYDPAVSVRFEGAASLVRRGLIEAVGWPPAEPLASRLDRVYRRRRAARLSARQAPPQDGGTAAA
ncbi:MAG TPA: glycosyltransferase family 2 protein [Hyphomicrobiales bacterium]|nr:glycosyltransferase family 2 protein [Hyphomicrobiales bacterium]